MAIKSNCWFPAWGAGAPWAGTAELVFMETPEAYQIARIPWQLFGTLTFKSERLPERVRLTMWFAFLRLVGKRLGVKFPRLLWCLRQEAGEIGGRRHFHCLLAGLPRTALCPSLNFELMAAWQKLGGGWARVSLYRHDLDGVGYALKGLGYASEAEQHYEMQKFGSQHCHLILSNSVWQTLHRANLGRHQTAARAIR